MSLHRKNPKRDGNEAEIIDALKKAGASVVQLSGEGLPDLLVGRRGVNYALEVKMPKGTLELAQEDFHASWRGQYRVVRTPAQALAAIGVKGKF